MGCEQGRGDFSYLLGQAKLESGLNASARASTSSASGLYQFIDQSWLSVVKQHGAEYGLGWAADSIQSSGGRMSVADGGTRQAILALRNNPDVAAAMAAEHASDNADALQASLGRTANGTDLYMAHFLGLGGARKFLTSMQANPGASGASLFPAAAHANRNVFYNSDGSAKSLADIYNRFSDKLGASAAAAGTTQPLPPMEMVSRTLGLGGEATVITGAGETASDAVQWAQHHARSAQGRPRSDADRQRPAPDPRHRKARLYDAREPRRAGVMKSLLPNMRSSALPAAILLLVLLMTVPIPAAMLDIFFVMNIAISLAVLMVALNAQKPLDFSAFPTVLLFATLFRLGLNVASTRVVLAHGHEGEAAAGHVIEAFGSFLIGGDYIVGIFVFSILVIINLIVVTKGAGRVSEVSARFTLDALPGKQMAIDADLNAGLLTPNEAKARRIEVSTEADFYGSMDGSSKFVKGDAVAGLLILFANIIGGLILGPVSHGLTIGVAAKTYILLAIGDALVAQLPSLMLSIAAAAIVTRVNSEKDLAGQIGSQFGSPRTWLPVAVILGLLGVLPGMPHMVLLPAAAIAGFASWKLRQIARRPVPVEVVKAEPLDQSKIGWDEVTDAMQVNLDIGYGLVPLVDERKGALLMGRITGVRRQLSKELGFVVPQVRVRDDINLAPFTYRLMVNGVCVGEDSASPDEMLALDTGNAVGHLQGKKAKDPTFGLDATWIAPGDADIATGSGYLVVDAGTVVATHLNHVLGANASDLLGPDEVQSLLDGLKERAANLVASLSPNPLPLTTLTTVLKSLLAEGIPLKEFRRIAASIAVAAQRTQDAEEILELIRPDLGPLIIQKLCGVREPLRVMTLEGGLEGLLGQAVRSDPSRRHVIEPDLGRRIVEALQRAAQPMIAEAKPFALVVQPAIRVAIRKLVKTVLPDTPVMSFFEVPEDKAVEVIAVIGAPQAIPA